MKNSITTRSAALAMVIAVLSATPAVAQQGVESGSAANTAIDSRRDEGTNWGWLGLIGLAGLAGLRRKHDDTVTVRPSTAAR